MSSHFHLLLQPAHILPLEEDLKMQMTQRLFLPPLLSKVTVLLSQRERTLVGIVLVLKCLGVQMRQWRVKLR